MKAFTSKQEWKHLERSVKRLGYESVSSFIHSNIIKTIAFEDFDCDNGVLWLCIGGKYLYFEFKEYD